MKHTIGLESLKPTIEVEYRIRPNMLEDGTFDNVPKNAVGAYVSQSFPTVSPYGDYRMSTVSFNIFVGLKISIDNVYNETKSTKTKKNLNEMKAKEYKEIVVLNYPYDNSEEIRPIKFGEIVVSSNQELAELLSKIYKEYNSITKDIRNSQKEIDESIRRPL